MRRLTASAVLLIASACFDDFLTGPEPNLETQLRISVRVIHDDTANYRVSGTFIPGSDALGGTRAFQDSAMIVAGSAIHGIRSPSGGLLVYAWGDSTTFVRDTIGIRGPTVEQQQAPTPTILVHVPGRTDAAFFEHVVGEDLRLSVTTLGEAPHGFGSDVETWELEIRDARQNRFPLLTVRRFGAPASPIIIPWQLVGAVAGDSLVATVQSFASYTSVLTPYPTFLSVSSQITWQLRVVAPSPLVQANPRH